MDLSKFHIGFIGGGNMAVAIAKGLIEKGLLKADQVTVSATSVNNLRPRWSPLGVTKLTTSNVDVVRASQIIFLCVKPHILEEVGRSLEGHSWDDDKLMVSVLARVTLEKLDRVFGMLSKADFSFVRTMPNTPMQIGEGCIIYCAKLNESKPSIRERYEAVKFMLGQVGLAYEVKESQMDGITSLTGCGPAFVYQIVEAFADAAVKQGAAREMALRMAAQTVMGAAKTVLVTGKHPAVLKDEVCSPGGATICGVHELEKGALRATLMNAVETASKRASELK